MEINFKNQPIDLTQLSITATLLCKQSTIVPHAAIFLVKKQVFASCFGYDLFWIQHLKRWDIYTASEIDSFRVFKSLYSF